MFTDFIVGNRVDDEVLLFKNLDVTNLVTPVKADVLEKLLVDTNYPDEEREFVIDGFKNGFSLGYNGNQNVKMTAPNLRFTVGNKRILWNKVMKEVKLRRYAGPFSQIPFKNYIQSPIGLVAKDGG